MGEDFVNIPNNVGKKNASTLQEVKGAWEMIDVEIHWSVLLISWLKRYPWWTISGRMPYQGPKVCPVQHWARARTRVPPTHRSTDHGTSFGTSHKSSWKPTGRGSA
ncbi:Hypothetical protein FKW44_013056 [Caligus rogercresseyi]|uniref:Uncharacterized protein n=1 Tax=Caligus rogercresseyi TaxID=217165 RepID=A0A7T8HKK6_CALRO|nr:Hypothetical protein FKW44_013056 [Caligus rogercresseyi]